MTFLDAASEKSLRSTVALTAARGRGKSAALGLAVAGTIAQGYSNIFITAPTPENLRTLFKFVVKASRTLCKQVKVHLQIRIFKGETRNASRVLCRGWKVWNTKSTLTLTL